MKTVYAIMNEDGLFYCPPGDRPNAPSQGTHYNRWREFPKFHPYVTRRWAQRQANILQSTGLTVVPIEVKRSS
jgi:hypothetical protein